MVDHKALFDHSEAQDSDSHHLSTRYRPMRTLDSAPQLAAVVQFGKSL